MASAPKSDGGKVPGDVAVKEIAAELEVSIVTVNVNLPYQNVVYTIWKIAAVTQSGAPDIKNGRIRK